MGKVGHMSEGGMYVSGLEPPTNALLKVLLYMPSNNPYVPVGEHHILELQNSLRGPQRRRLHGKVQTSKLRSAAVPV